MVFAKVKGLLTMTHQEASSNYLAILAWNYGCTVQVPIIDFTYQELSVVFLRTILLPTVLLVMYLPLTVEIGNILSVEKGMIRIG